MDLCLRAVTFTNSIASDNFLFPHSLTPSSAFGILSLFPLRPNTCDYILLPTHPVSHTHTFGEAERLGVDRFGGTLPR